MPDPELAGAARDVVHAALGAPVRSVALVERGVMTWKYDVASDAGRFVVRFYPPGRESVLAVEPDLLRRVAAAGLPVPEVVADARDGPEAPHPWVCYRRLPGEPLDLRWDALDERARASVAGELADRLDALHALGVAGHGDLVDARTARHPSRAAFLARCFDEGLGVAPLSPALAADLAALRERLEDAVVEGPPGLCWGDVSPANVLVDDAGRVSGLLDFEGPLAAEREAGLGFCAAGQAGAPFHAALAAARPDRDPDRVDLWAVVRGLRLAAHAARPRLPAGAPRDPVEAVLPGLAPAAARLRQRWASGT